MSSALSSSSNSLRSQVKDEEETVQHDIQQLEEVTPAEKVEEVIKKQEEEGFSCFLYDKMKQLCHVKYSIKSLLKFQAATKARKPEKIDITGVARARGSSP